MIAFVQGVIEDITEDNVVLAVGGMGINVKISASTAARLPGAGAEVRLYTYTLVREDAFLLYGFLSKNDLDIFKQCITVNGIGPKGALSILSVMDADSLRFAIMTKNVKAISQAPGIGARTAERLILELKDKLHVDDVLIGKEVAATAQNLAIGPQKQEAVAALVALGYGQAESIKAVNAISGIEDMDSGAVLKAALKHLL